MRAQATIVAYVGASEPSPHAAAAERLAAVVTLRRLVDRLEADEVERAMRAGWSWQQVAQVLGVTRQAVHKKHARRLIDAGVEVRRRRG
jgi:transcriptional regulator with GAF, ATPase, and Fis domain